MCHFEHTIIDCEETEVKWGRRGVAQREMRVRNGTYRRESDRKWTERIGRTKKERFMGAERSKARWTRNRGDERLGIQE